MVLAISGQIPLQPRADSNCSAPAAYSNPSSPNSPPPRLAINRRIFTWKVRCSRTCGSCWKKCRPTPTRCCRGPTSSRGATPPRTNTVPALKKWIKSSLQTARGARRWRWALGASLELGVWTFRTTGALPPVQREYDPRFKLPSDRPPRPGLVACLGYETDCFAASRWRGMA